MKVKFWFQQWFRKHWRDIIVYYTIVTISQIKINNNNDLINVHEWQWIFNINDSEMLWSYWEETDLLLFFVLVRVLLKHEYKCDFHKSNEIKNKSLFLYKNVYDITVLLNWSVVYKISVSCYDSLNLRVYISKQQNACNIYSLYKWTRTCVFK